MEPTENSEKSEPQMGFEPTTIHDLSGSSNHWASEDCVVSKGKMWVFESSCITQLQSEITPDSMYIILNFAHLGYLYKHQWNTKSGSLLSNARFIMQPQRLLSSRSCEDNILSSRVKISSFGGKAHLVFHWCLYNKNNYQTNKFSFL